MFSLTLVDQITPFLAGPGSVLLAYLDPGSGSMLLQLLFASLLSGLFFLKSFSAAVRETFDRFVKKSSGSTAA